MKELILSIAIAAGMVLFLALLSAAFTAMLREKEDEWAQIYREEWDQQNEEKK